MPRLCPESRSRVTGHVTPAAARQSVTSESLNGVATLLPSASVVPGTAIVIHSVALDAARRPCKSTSLKSSPLTPPAPKKTCTLSSFASSGLARL